MTLATSKILVLHNSLIKYRLLEQIGCAKVGQADVLQEVTRHKHNNRVATPEQSLAAKPLVL